MPYGRFSPSAKTDICSGFPSLLMPRNTRISPAPLSARKMSPFGAVLSNRGLFSPAAYNSTLNPFGAIGHAFAGRATTSGAFSADDVAYGGGRSFTVIFRVVPGFSYRKSVNGAFGAGALIVDVIASAGAAGGSAGAPTAPPFPGPIVST